MSGSACRGTRSSRSRAWTPQRCTGPSASAPLRRGCRLCTRRRWPSRRGGPRTPWQCTPCRTRTEGCRGWCRGRSGTCRRGSWSTPCTRGRWWRCMRWTRRSRQCRRVGSWCTRRRLARCMAWRRTCRRSSCCTWCTPRPRSRHSPPTGSGRWARTWCTGRRRCHGSGCKSPRQRCRRSTSSKHRTLRPWLRYTPRPAVCQRNPSTVCSLCLKWYYKQRVGRTPYCRYRRSGTRCFAS